MGWLTDWLKLETDDYAAISSRVCALVGELLNIPTTGTFSTKRLQKRSEPLESNLRVLNIFGAIGKLPPVIPSAATVLDILAQKAKGATEPPAEVPTEQLFRSDRLQTAILIVALSLLLLNGKTEEEVQKQGEQLIACCKDLMDKDTSWILKHIRREARDDESSLHE